MKRLGIIALMLCATSSFGQGVDTLLEGRWELFNIIDNMSGDAIAPSHKTTEKFVYFIDFNQHIVKYNLEINKCENEVVVGKDHSIKFKYFSNCSEICCDAEFSELLTYDDCTTYYIKEKKTLIMISEDRIFYFNKVTRK